MKRCVTRRKTRRRSWDKAGQTQVLSEQGMINGSVESKV